MMQMAVLIKSRKSGSEKGKSIILEGVYFNTGSASLNPNSMTILDKVDLHFVGYLCNRSGESGDIPIILVSYQRNMSFKEQGDEVKIYLMSKGSMHQSPHRGFGPENPIATQQPKDGVPGIGRMNFSG